jgi:hypothetical protein
VKRFPRLDQSVTPVESLPAVAVELNFVEPFLALRQLVDHRAHVGSMKRIFVAGKTLKLSFIAAITPE